MEKLLSKAKEVREVCERMESPLIVHHYDADGISAATIAYSFFKKRGKKVRLASFHSLTEETFELLKNEKDVIFIDLGSATDRVNELNNAVVIDHHNLNDRIDVPMLNPWKFGYDGGRFASSSSLSFVVFEERPELSLVGSAGDVQLPFEGLNRHLLESLDCYERKIDISFYGRESRSLPVFLAYSDVYIRGVSGRIRNVKRELEAMGISLKMGTKERSYEELSEEEKIKIRSWLARLLIRTGAVEKISDVFSEVYLLKKGTLPKRDLREMATMVNSCGRYGRSLLGIRLCLGDRKAEKEFQRLLRHHKSKIREAREKAKENIVVSGNLVIVDGRESIDSGIIGIVCSSLQREMKKNILGIAKEGRKVKVSLRSIDVNAGEILSEIARRHGGEGGGHKLAGGAELDESQVPNFIKEISEVIKGF